MNKTWTLLTLALLLCVGPAMAVPTGSVQTPVQCAGGPLSAIFSSNTQAPAANPLFGPAPVNQDQPVCSVMCVTSQCSNNGDCTAAPNGHCNFACPSVGCCVYPQ